MRILVTGGCGYVGTGLVPALLNDGHEVVVFDVMWFGNVLSAHSKLAVHQVDIQQPYYEFPDVGDIDACVHLAAVADDPSSLLDESLTYRVGLHGTLHILEYARERGCKVFIHASSGSIYGEEVDEQGANEEESPTPDNYYNEIKLLAEQHVQRFAAKNTGCRVCILRPASISGYSSRLRLETSINQMTVRALTDPFKIVRIDGNAHNSRPFVGMGELVNTYRFLLNNDVASGTFNSPCDNMTLLEAGKKISSILGYGYTVNQAARVSGNYRMDCGKILRYGFARSADSIGNAIRSLADAYRAGSFIDEDKHYNLRVMRKLCDTQS